MTGDLPDFLHRKTPTHEEERTVPLNVHLAERKKRQAAEARVVELEGKVLALEFRIAELEAQRRTE